MMNFRDDSGMTLAELMVVLLLMGFVMAAVYMGLQFTTGARNTAEQQAAFASSITAPMDSMDNAFSQSLRANAGTTIDPYSVTLQMPSAYRQDGVTVYRTFVANTDGSLWEYDRLNSSSAQPYRSFRWSTTNHNRSDPTSTTALFQYYVGQSTQATTLAGAESVVITVVSQYNGKTFTDSRRVYFRNK